MLRIWDLGYCVVYIGSYDKSRVGIVIELGFVEEVRVVGGVMGRGRKDRKIYFRVSNSFCIII